MGRCKALIQPVHCLPCALHVEVRSNWLRSCAPRSREILAGREEGLSQCCQEHCHARTAGLARAMCHWRMEGVCNRRNDLRTWIWDSCIHLKPSRVCGVRLITLDMLTRLDHRQLSRGVESSLKQGGAGLLTSSADRRRGVFRCLSNFVRSAAATTRWLRELEGFRECYTGQWTGRSVRCSALFSVRQSNQNRLIT